MIRDTQSGCICVEPEPTPAIMPARMRDHQDNRPWAIILAGGDGIRLRPLTRMLTGDERPKQFCRIIGGETLLRQTTRRIGHLVRPERTVVVVTRTHAQFLDPDANSTAVIAQPENRGTAAAILYGLLSIGTLEPDAHVALLPADHYFANDAIFMKHVDHAFQAVRQRSDLTILLGIVADGPEVDYGWIQPGESVRGVAGGSLLRVQGFWEKPSPTLAEALFELGCFWNSLIVVSSVPALLRLIRRTVPDLFESFRDAAPALHKPAEADVVSAIYSQISPVDFSRQVLPQCPDSLTVLPVADAGWVDVGQPDRVRALFARRKVQPYLAS